MHSCQAPACPPAGRPGSRFPSACRPRSFPDTAALCCGVELHCDPPPRPYVAPSLACLLRSIPCLLDDLFHSTALRHRSSNTCLPVCVKILLHLPQASKVLSRPVSVELQCAKARHSRESPQPAHAAAGPAAKRLLPCPCELPKHVLQAAAVLPVEGVRLWQQRAHARDTLLHTAHHNTQTHAHASTGSRERGGCCVGQF